MQYVCQSNETQFILNYTQFQKLGNKLVNNSRNNSVIALAILLKKLWLPEFYNLLKYV